MRKLLLPAMAYMVGILMTQPLMAQEFRVKKDAAGTYNRTWTWKLEKSADTENLLLATKQTATVNYSVVASATSRQTWTVTGNFHATNLTGFDIVITKIVDRLNDGTVATVTCLAEGFCNDPLQSGWTRSYSYVATGTGTKPESNTVSFYTRDARGAEIFLGSATELITWTAGSEIDECINVSDLYEGVPSTLGSVCANDTTRTQKFTYSKIVGPYDLCSSNDSKCNVAAFLTNDTGTIGGDSWCVNINTAPCQSGCTLTPGYWKTHSKYGPAPYDSRWAQIGEDAAFYLSGDTWYSVLWTTPAGGNAYYILAHAYIAAKLNLLTATAPGSVNTAMIAADNFFKTYTPSSTFSKAVRNAALQNATTLDNYNNGLNGPGHCSETK
jgi:hypothetical protein